MQPIILAPKFKPFTLDRNSRGANRVLFSKLQTIFTRANSNPNPIHTDNGFNSIDRKGHIVEHPLLPGWIIKGQRHDATSELTQPDTHIYRVRRAEKLRNLNPKEFVIPKKYVYQYKGIWYVIAEKLELAPMSNYCREKVRFTPAQAEEGARLAYLGKLDDVSYSNIVTTTDGKLALIDTEPLTRAFTKRIDRSLLRFLPLLKTTVRLANAQANSEQLHDRVSNELGSRKIREIQNTMLKKFLIQVVKLIALPIIIAIGLTFFGATGAIATAATVFAGVSAIYGTLLVGSMLFAQFYLMRREAHYTLDANST